MCVVLLLLYLQIYEWNDARIAPVLFYLIKGNTDAQDSSVAAQWRQEPTVKSPFVCVASSSLVVQAEGTKSIYFFISTREKRIIIIISKKTTWLRRRKPSNHQQMVAEHICYRAKIWQSSWSGQLFIVVGLDASWNFSHIRVDWERKRSCVCENTKRIQEANLNSSVASCLFLRGFAEDGAGFGGVCSGSEQQPPPTIQQQISTTKARWTKDVKSKCVCSCLFLNDNTTDVQRGRIWLKKKKEKKIRPEVTSRTAGVEKRYTRSRRGLCWLARLSNFRSPFHFFFFGSSFPSPSFFHSSQAGSFFFY